MELAYKRALAKQYPTLEHALAALAQLKAQLVLPKATSHVVSDVHGEHEKLRQVINNASGSMRPLVERLFPGQDVSDLLATIYYPLESWEKHRGDLKQFVARVVIILRELVKGYTITHVEEMIPDPLDPVLRELIFSTATARPQAFVDALIAPFVKHGREAELVRLLAQLVRDLAIGELIVAGDLGDRGPRLDRVIEVLEQQPAVALTWGNHDVDWLAAAMGHEVAVATVVRLSLRYQRIAQLEEGFGISLNVLKELVRQSYADDPAEHFGVKGDAGADALLYARMQKAIAIIQFKLEGLLFERHPEWGMQDRAMLRRIDPAAGTIALNGKTYPLLDTRFPTVDWADPHALSSWEIAALLSLQMQFARSTTLWRQWTFVAKHARMWLRRDRCVIFHGCVPVSAEGEFLPFVVDGQEVRGRALFDALDRVIQRALRTRDQADMDLVFYLWTGPLSPCFGKDKMATFETYFIADKATQQEHKNPYFKLLDDAAFCRRVLEEFGVDPGGFVINGHMPVKLDAGEQPIKKCGRAITIDGAFAAAYGDKGFSLVLGAERMWLAQHTHFDGPDAAVEEHADIVPTVSDVEVYPSPRLVGDTEVGDELRAEIAALEELVDAFENNTV